MLLTDFIKISLRLVIVSFICVRINAQDCWTSGCQPDTWAVRGCPNDMNTVGSHPCEGGMKYDCCSKNSSSTTTVAPTRAPGDCWWSGCQPTTWAVRGCPTDMDTIASEACEGGDKYQCCKKIATSTTASPVQTGQCWWSSCQPSTWENEGCPADMKTDKSESCDDGKRYNCCEIKSDKTVPEYPGCWWSGCQPFTWEVRGCPKNHTQVSSKSCENGTLFQCCEGSSDDDDSLDSYIDYVKFLLLSSSNFTIKPDSLSCTSIDPEKDFILEVVGNDGFRICDLCPYLPQMKLKNMFINTKPSETSPNRAFSECFGLCTLNVECVALSYDIDDKICYLFNHTVGKFKEEDGWITVLMTPPINVVRNYAYSRHTSLDGQNFQIKNTNTFLDCIEICDKDVKCNLTSYSFSNKQCKLFNSLNDVNFVDLEYGFVAAFNIELLHKPNDVSWRFTDEISLDTTNTDLSQSTSQDKVCPKLKDSNLGNYYFQGCKLSGGLGCDPKTSCRKCYYPEKENKYRNDLVICPDSELLTKEKVKTKLDKGMKDCLENTNCISIDFNVENLDCELNDIENPRNQKTNATVLKYQMFFPKKENSYHGVLKKFSLLPNYSIEQIKGSPTFYQSSSVKNVEECSKLCLQQSNCKKFSYSNKDCKLGSEHVSLVKSQSNTFVKKSNLNSVYIEFIRTPGIYLELSKATKTETYNCKEDCSSKTDECLKLCTGTYREWCEQISIEHLVDKVNCYFFSWKTEDLNILGGNSWEIFTRNFNSSITLDSLNSLGHFQSTDFLNCFNQNNEQTSTSLATVKENEQSSVALRRRRGFWDGVKNFFKGVGNAVKDTVNTVVKTVEKGAESVKKVFQGDLKGAKDAFMEIPIVKDVKNVVKFGEAVIKGDWDKVKERGLDLLQSSVLDIIPGPGKLIKAGGKILKNTVKQSTKKTKDVVTRDTKKNLKEKETKNKKTKNNEDDEKLDEGRDRCKRATKRKRKTTPGDKCKDDPDDNDKTTCKRPKTKYSIPESFLECGGRGRRKGPGSKCNYECNPGYDESPHELTCVNSNNAAVWSPAANCVPEKCAGGLTPLMVIKTPQKKTLAVPGTGKNLVAYVILFNRARKLPVWSVAFHQNKEQFYTASYNEAKDLERKDSFYEHPCLGSDQTSNAIYLNSGYDRGHLTPANIVRWSLKGTISINLYANVAPQDPYTNQQPWEKLEAHVECYTKKQLALVATGICPSSLGKVKGIDVPSCYWKLMCYRDEDDNHQVVGFYADNSNVPYKGTVGKTPAAVKAQRDRSIAIAKPYSQTELSKLTGFISAVNPWEAAASQLYQGRFIQIGAGALSGTYSPINPFECSKAVDLSKEEKDLWESNLIGKLTPKRRKRAANTKKFRGCSPGEGKGLAALLGLKSLFLDDDGDFGIDDEERKKRGGGGNPLVEVSKCGKRIIGYFTSWGKQDFTPSQAQRLTHLVYAFLEITSDGTIIVGSPDRKNSENPDEEAEKSKRKLQQVFEVASSYPHLKVMFAVGGWENSQYFSAIASSAERRLRFIASVIETITKWKFDGVDIDWEYPVTGGAVEGIPVDKSNYVQLMKELREALDQHSAANGNNDRYLISFAGAAGQWTLDPGYDLPGLLKYADWVNVMTYDFFGAWESKWGAYTGPPAPLFFAMPPRFSGKTNVAWTVKYYSCKSQKPHQINMGLPFYGRFWRNVGSPVDPSDGMWRTAEAVNGKFVGGYASWRDIKNEWLNKPGYQHTFHQKAKTPYAFSAAEKVYLGYENPESLKFKVDHATEKNLGGLMVWAIDQDDDDLTMLDSIYNAPLCSKTSPTEINQKCSPIDEKRWWTSEDGDDFAGLCGRSAPLYKGYYPVCDPDDPGYSCCGHYGYCGSGDKYCECPTCVDYGNNPEKIVEKPVKPTVPVTWYFLNAPEGKRGKCGKSTPKINGVFPTCNPDDPNAHCCSNGDYCGTGPGFCNCDKCVDFTKNPNYIFT